MKLLKLTVLIAAVAVLGVVMRAQQSGTATSPVAPGASASPGIGTAAQSAVLKILSPKTGEKLATNWVNVKFEIKGPNTTSNFPNFRVQLDGGDPIRTTSPEYTFTGLAPGAHTVTVEMVDANEIPLPGSRAEVHFNVVSQQPQPTGAGISAPGAAHVIAASLIPEAQGSSQNDSLPSSGSSLPLLSVIGFGVLLGGIASALKTR